MSDGLTDRGWTVIRMIIKKQNFSNFNIVNTVTLYAAEDDRKLDQENSTWHMQMHGHTQVFWMESSEGMEIIHNIYTYIFYNADWENNMDTLYTSQH